MSFVACPLCGKNSPVSNFNPERLDNDIYMGTATGLGRGRGFSSPRVSILDSGPDNDILQRIGERVLRIVKILKDKEILDDDEILKVLHIETAEEEEGSDDYDENDERESELLQRIEDESEDLAHNIARLLR